MSRAKNLEILYHVTQPFSRRSSSRRRPWGRGWVKTTSEQRKQKRTAPASLPNRFLWIDLNQLPNFPVEATGNILLQIWFRTWRRLLSCKYWRVSTFSFKEMTFRFTLFTQARVWNSLSSVFFIQSYKDEECQRICKKY